MARGFVPLILLASLLYATTYLFIKVAVEEIEPATLSAARLVMAAPLLVAVLSLRGGVRHAFDELRRAGRDGFVVGLVTFAAPLTLIALGEKWVDSGVAAIAIAATPLFVELFARRLWPSERVTGLRLAGVLLGFVGVGVLTGAAPGGNWAEIGGTCAVLGAALLFARGSLYAQAGLARSSTLTLAAAASMWGGLALLPLGVAQLPSHVPGWKVLGALAALTVVNSIASQLLSFHLVRRYGSARNSLSTYLTPPFALAIGAVVLDERIGAFAVAGLVLILVGVALGSGVARTPLAARAASPVP